MFCVKSVGRAAVPAICRCTGDRDDRGNRMRDSDSITPAPAPAPAAAAPSQSTPAPVEVHTNLEFGGPQVSIFHPDTRTLYLWSSDPRPGPPHRDPNCIKIQMSDSPSGGPVTNEPCS